MEDKNSNVLDKSPDETVSRKFASAGKLSFVLGYTLLLLFRLFIFGAGFFVMYYLFFVYMKERTLFHNFIFFACVTIATLVLIYAIIDYVTKIPRCIKKDNPP